MTKSSRHRVVIVGGGFAGVKAALELSEHSDKFDVTLISDRSDFRYYPTLYHTATGGRAAQSSIPLATIFDDKQVEVQKGRVKRIDRDKKKVLTDLHRELPYDTLILALGAITNFFGIDGMKKFSYGIKSVEDAKRFKAHLHKQLEDERKPDLNYVIIGGGQLVLS